MTTRCVARGAAAEVNIIHGVRIDGYRNVVRTLRLAKAGSSLNNSARVRGPCQYIRPGGAANRPSQGPKSGGSAVTTQICKALRRSRIDSNNRCACVLVNGKLSARDLSGKQLGKRRC